MNTIAALESVVVDGSHILPDDNRVEGGGIEEGVGLDGLYAVANDEFVECVDRE